MPVVTRSLEPASETAARLAAPLAATLAQRGLAAPALLFVAGHRPLAFAAGQLLALAAPLAAVLGQAHLMDWAHLLATTEGVDGLQAALAEQGGRRAAREEHRP